MNYPNPCDTCTKRTCLQLECPDFRKRVNTIWKQFNAYPARVYRAQKTMRNEKFTYEHPDIVRQYLEKGPCAACKRAKACEIPCPAYWHWWDARRELHKRRFGL